MKKYYMVWIHEEEEWYYFKEDFDKEAFKDGYVSYEITVIDGIIRSDEWSPHDIGSLFSKCYDTSLWN